MFTGIVQTMGTVGAIACARGARRLTIRAKLARLAIGESIAVNGVCLTVVRKGRGDFQADVSPESLRRTALGALRVGARVNLERALRPADRLGGHIVQGHVDAVGRVDGIVPEGNGWMYTFEAPAGVARYLVEKGSITVDGISLTVAAVRGRCFKVAVIPHTAEQTSLGDRKIGEKVNLEADVVAKYVEKLLGLNDKKKAPGRRRAGGRAAGKGKRR